MARVFLSFARLGLLAVCGVGSLPVAALAQDNLVVEQTRLRLSVFQFAPDTGQYSRSDALSAEIVVGAGGMINVPVIGPMAIGDKTPEAVAKEIAARLQTQLGLIDPPNASLEILSYPPIYVVGAVEEPGEYSFRPGMTVLQALAVGGGQLRSDTAADSGTERIRLLAQLRGFEDQISRTGLRVARLEADLADEDSFAPPAGSDGETQAQELAVLQAGRTQRDRQIASLTDLKDLYQREIEVLETRIGDLEQSIEATQSELAGVEKLVESGIATVSRRSELERVLSSLRSDRLEQTTAIMRARQFMTEAERNADAIEDTRRTELTQQLLTERGTLEQVTLEAETTRALLADLDRQLLSQGASDAETQLSFTIVRMVAADMEEIAAGEAATLLPSDVVKVSVTAASGTGSQD